MHTVDKIPPLRGEDFSRRGTEVGVFKGPLATPENSLEGSHVIQIQQESVNHLPVDEGKKNHV